MPKDNDLVKVKWSGKKYWTFHGRQRIKINFFRQVKVGYCSRSGELDYLELNYSQCM